MADESRTVILLPQIAAASISPNPVQINQKFILTITAEEIEKFLEPVIYYSGEIYAGEV
ncbi:MAG: hypothetical protein J6C52_05080 [Clostridia bacterium]|nr:hypothetical protein [Clostridia bacterium]